MQQMISILIEVLRLPFDIIFYIINIFLKQTDHLLLEYRYRYQNKKIFDLLGEKTHYTPYYVRDSKGLLTGNIRDYNEYIPTRTSIIEENEEIFLIMRIPCEFISTGEKIQPTSKGIPSFILNINWDKF